MIDAPAPSVLVTGLNSLTGWNIYSEARRRGPAAGTYRKWHRVFRGPQLYRVNWQDDHEVDAFLERLRPSVIIHAWGICDLDLCETMPELARRINVEGTVRILRKLQTLPGLRKFVYLSTDHVFDGAGGSYSEEDTPRPIHAYGRSKAEAEEKVARSGLPFTIIRTGLTIGSSVQGTIGPRDFLLSRLRAGKKTHYFVDEWRSPMDASAMARGVLDLALGPETGLFHLGGGERWNRYELARRLAETAGLEADKVLPRFRREDVWSHIRPFDLTLKSGKISPLPFSSEVPNHGSGND